MEHRDLASVGKPLCGQQGVGTGKEKRSERRAQTRGRTLGKRMETVTSSIWSDRSVKKHVNEKKK